MNGASLDARARPCALMYMPCPAAYTRLVPNRLSQFTRLALCQAKGTMHVVTTVAVAAMKKRVVFAFEWRVTKEVKI